MAPSFTNDVSLFDFAVRHGNGVKGVADLGLSTVPNRYVQPPEERISVVEAGKFEQAPIDLSKLEGPNHDDVVKEIVMAAETLGFFQVINHGMSLELLESLKETAHKFFNQPAEKKAVYRKGVSPSALVTYGTSFSPEKEKALEWKDYISMAYTNEDDALEQWPKECREVALEYLKKSEELARKLLEALMGNITGEKLDDKKGNAMLGFKMVNMNFYPKCPNPELTVGVGRHSDMGTLTILLQDGIGGLYVKAEEDTEALKKGQWVEIPPVPGALVINIGDALQILSNGRYKSAEHRVRATNAQSRVSIPVFTTPLPTEKIGPLPQVVEKDGVAHYRTVLFGEYMKNFFGNVHDGKKSLDFARVM